MATNDEVEQSFLRQLPPRVLRWLEDYHRCAPELKDLNLARLLVNTYGHGLEDGAKAKPKERS